MADYKPNSDRSRVNEEQQENQERKTGKVISGDAHRRKQSSLTKVGTAVGLGDGASVKDYMMQAFIDVLIPTVKRAVSDIVCNSINILLGEPTRTKSGSTPASRTNYRAYYDQSNERKDYNRPRAQSNYSYDDIVFPTRGDAEEVLYRMEELLDRFDMVSVADLFDMAGISCNYTDNKYGWKSLRDARIERVSDGYIIRLPRATTL